MNMTEEMKNIIMSEHKHIIVQAYAGAGKTSTMLDYVKFHPNERILFLVYNKEMSLDFSKRLKGIRHNCEVKTIHSLAYGWFRKNFVTRQLRNINIIDIEKILNIDLSYPQLSKIKFYLDMYLTSDLDDVKDLKVINQEDFSLLYYVKKVWLYLVNSSDFIPHNVYLKLFQLAKIKLNYETIIQDETNDINKCMLSILTNNLDKKIIAVGDSYQMINAFNFNCDGLAILRDEYNFKQYNLTNSFRVSEKIANMSSRYLTYMYKDSLKFKGLGSTNMKKLDILNASKDNQIHLLCRTRLGGLKQVADILDKDDGKKIYYVGGLDGFGLKEVERILSYRGKVYIGGKIFHINQLRQMLKEGVDDPEISRICSIYTFGEKNSDLIDLIKKTEVKDRKDADIIVLTSHSSKGLTLKNGILGNDFPSVEQIRKEMYKPNLHEYVKRVINSECNLLYVALTRFTDNIDIGQTFNKDDKIDKSKKNVEVLDYK